MHLGLDRPRSRPRPIRLRRKAPILLQGRQIAFERLCRHPRTAGRAAREISPSSPGASRRAWGNRARFRTSDRAHAVGEGDAPRRRPAVPAAVPPRDPGREAKTDSSPLGSGTLYDKSYLSYKVRFLLAPWYNTLFGAAGRGRETGPPAAPGIRGGSGRACARMMPPCTSRYEPCNTSEPQPFRSR